MPPAEVNKFTKRLVNEYERARATLLDGFSNPHNRDEAIRTIQATLSLCTVQQAEIITGELNAAMVAGIYIQADFLRNAIPAYVGVDLTKVSSTHLNRITKDYIGYIGGANKELERTLKRDYSRLLTNNAIVNQLNEKGWSQQVEKQLVKLGYKDDFIQLVKQQTTANKMVSILETNGIRGGMHPNDVAKALRPVIRDVFGDGGVLINNTGKLRTQLVVDADGNFRLIKRTITQPYRTTVANYADSVARTSMLKAHNEGRLATLQQSGLCEREYRYIADMTENTCTTCAMMNGQVVDPDEIMPPIHPKCGCRLGAIWKAETGLANHSDEYYEKQRNEWFWKQQQVKDYNKTLPAGQRIANYNFLPESARTPMPGADEMRSIRGALLPSVA